MFTFYKRNPWCVCNITGKKFKLKETEKNREGGIRFDFNIRSRAICYVFSKLLFGEILVIKNIEINKSLKGAGMSDAGWASIFEEKFSYINTFYHTEPCLDVYNEEHINRHKDLDFLISSDVFEHISPFPDIQIAFNNLYQLLKINGVLIFSVPFDYGEHVEHYPNLYKYEIKLENNNYVLYNKTIDNKTERFEDLCFHGGVGVTLEMRKFSKTSIEHYLREAGFKEIIFHEITKDMNRYGIFWSADNKNNCSLIISAKKI